MRCGPSAANTGDLVGSRAASGLLGLDAPAQSVIGDLLARHALDVIRRGATGGLDRATGVAATQRRRTARTPRRDPGGGVARRTPARVGRSSPRQPRLACSTPARLAHPHCQDARRRPPEAQTARPGTSPGGCSQDVHVGQIERQVMALVGGQAALDVGRRRLATAGFLGLDALSVIQVEDQVQRLPGESDLPAQDARRRGRARRRPDRVAALHTGEGGP